MRVRFLSMQKACAVCEYWDGPRKVSPDKTKMETAYNSQSGICRNPNATSATKGKQVNASYSSCIRFVKSQALK